MAFAKRKGTAIAVRRPVTSSPKFIAIQKRVSGLSKRSLAVAKEAEIELPMLTLAGAALPAIAARYGKPLPSLGGIDSELLAGGAIMAISLALRGRTRRMAMAVGAGCAAPAVSRAIKSGTIKVGEDDDDDDETAGGTEI